MAIAVERPGWDAVLDAGRPPAGDRLVHSGGEEPREGRLEPFPLDLDPRLQSALIAQGIAAVYGHQAAAWQAARSGRHVMVVTGTASGKSLAFNLPVLASLVERPGSRALYVYPTKALAQDQVRRLAEFRVVKPAIYDGDTPRTSRASIRRLANPVLTNPDMLHVGLLPNHARWELLLSALTHVVIDEAHVYRGVFGSHVACVLRRLRRVCALYGSDPQFLLGSATVANPGEAARALTGLDVEVVDDDHAPRARRQIAFWQPPLLDAQAGERASTLAEAAALLAALVCRGQRTICFCKTRKATELVFRIARDTLEAGGFEEAANRLAPYRAGYTAEERRAIEADLRSGALLGVVATDALELGIDVGLLDCAIATGFPGTVASLRQQWGRAGRRGEGLAVFIPSDDGLDQFFARHPEALLERTVEAAILDPTSREIRTGHLLAAADEVPLTQADDAVLGEGAYESARELRELVPTPRGLVWNGRGSPAARVGLRSASSSSITVVEASTGTILGSVEEARALWTVHEGAVYLHRGESHLVTRLDLDAGVALVEPHSGGFYTQPRRETDLRIAELLTGPERRAGVRLSYGRVDVTEHVVGYQRRRLPGHAPIDTVPLDLPERCFSTTALWFEPPFALLDGSPLGALHAAEHTLISVLPLYAMCDRWDIGGLSIDRHPQTQRPTVFVYDGHPGGVGLARRGFERFEGLVADAARILAECPCESGCPSCVQSPKCGNLNETLDKAAASRLLSAMSG